MVATSANVLDVLRARGFVAQVSDEDGLRRGFERGPVTLYQGFDPTATSLHTGNLVGIMALANLQRCGQRPIVVIGGGTGMIGDPSERASERPMLSIEEIHRNLEGIRRQFSPYLDFSHDRALMVDNADWLLELKWIEFLRDVGRHFTVNQLMQHGTYWERFQNESFSFIELNYALVQAYDFLHLYRELGCILQVGGNDQWFNISGRGYLVPPLRRRRGVRADHPAGDDDLGREAGQDSGERRVARPAADLAVRVLPVLAQYRGCGRWPLPAHVHVHAAGGDRRARAPDRRRPEPRQGGARVGGDNDHPRRRRGAQGAGDGARAVRRRRGRSGPRSGRSPAHERGGSGGGSWSGRVQERRQAPDPGRRVARQRGKGRVERQGARPGRAAGAAERRQAQGAPDRRLAVRPGSQASADAAVRPRELADGAHQVVQIERLGDAGGDGHLADALQRVVHGRDDDDVDAVAELLEVGGLYEGEAVHDGDHQVEDDGRRLAGTHG